MIKPTEDKRFFGRRKGKPIKESRQLLIDHLLPEIRLVLPEGNEKINLPAMFGASISECWLEVGFGGGEHVAELALKYQNVGFLGAEPFMNGVASLLAHLNGSHMKKSVHTHLADDRVDNVRIWPDDIRMVFPKLNDGIFKKIFVLYPDPWPKARHAERRFINQRNLPELYRLLAKDGCLYVATDVKDYADWALEQSDLSGLFVQVNQDISCPPEDWVPTRYEKKGLLAGRKPTYLVFCKKNVK